MRIFHALFHLVLPRLCVQCSIDLAPSENQLCSLCISKLPLTRFEHYQANPMFERISGFHRIAGAYAFLFYNHSNSTRTLLHAFKYGKKRLLGEVLSKLLSNHYRRVLQDIDYIITVPLHKSKLRKRGFNQAEVLAQRLSEALDAPLYSAVNRINQNKSQARQARTNRWINTNQLFELAKEANSTLREKNILIVDDVFTTGATVMAILDTIKVCEYASCRVLTLAYAEQD